MQIGGYIDEIKLKMTGDLLETEINDATMGKIVNSALRELQRYITATKMITIPYKKCIDLSNPADTNNVQLYVSSIASVHRSSSLTSVDEGDMTSLADPMYAAQWQMMGGLGNLNNFQNAAYNYGAWNTMLQIRNTVSTDLDYTFDEDSKKLYINTSMGLPSTITIRYIPKFNNVSEITSDYWIDILMRMSIALTKITLGRIRTRFTQSNALWKMDGETLLTEGTEELKLLREMLLSNSQYIYPMD